MERQTDSGEFFVRTITCSRAIVSLPVKLSVGCSGGLWCSAALICVAGRRNENAGKARLLPSPCFLLDHGSARESPYRINVREPREKWAERQLSPTKVGRWCSAALISVAERRSNADPRRLGVRTSSGATDRMEAPPTAAPRPCLGGQKLPPLATPDDHPTAPDRDPPVPDGDPALKFPCPAAPDRDPTVGICDPVTPDRDPALKLRRPPAPDRNPTPQDRCPPLPDRNPLLKNRKNPVPLPATPAMLAEFFDEERKSVREVRFSLGTISSATAPSA